MAREKPKRSWMVVIEDHGNAVSAFILNQQGLSMLDVGPIPYDPNDPDSWDEAVADLFAGPLPNIRDSFDQA